MPASTFVRALLFPAKSSMTAVMHTRFATQGHQKDRVNNHPIRTGGIVGVHNGQLWNDDWLFKTMGLTERRIGEVDSEAAFAAIAYGRDITGYTDVPDKPAKVHHRLAPDLPGILEEIEGSAALAWMDEEDGNNTLHVARLNQSPLVVAQTAGGSFFFASTEHALKGMCRANDIDFVWVEEVKEGTYYKVTDGIIVEATNFRPAPMYTVTHKPYAWEWDEMPNGPVYVSQWAKDKAAMAAVAMKTLARNEKAPVTREYVSSGDGVLRLVVPKGTSYDDLDDEMFDVMADEAMGIEFPPLDSALLHAGSIIDLDRSYYLETYEERERAIDFFVFRADAEIEGEFLGSVEAGKVGANLRPGRWVRTSFMGEDNYVGQIVTLPQTFPEGYYTLLLYVGNKGRSNNTERVFIRRQHDEFKSLHGDSLKEVQEIVNRTQVPADA